MTPMHVDDVRVWDVYDENYPSLYDFTIASMAPGENVMFYSYQPALVLPYYMRVFVWRLDELIHGFRTYTGERQDYIRVSEDTHQVYLTEFEKQRYTRVTRIR